MKIIKILNFVFAFFLLSGCAGGYDIRYDVTVHDSGKGSDLNVAVDDYINVCHEMNMRKIADNIYGQTRDIIFRSVDREMHGGAGMLETVLTVRGSEIVYLVIRSGDPDGMVTVMFRERLEKLFKAHNINYRIQQWRSNGFE